MDGIIDADTHVVESDYIWRPFNRELSDQLNVMGLFYDLRTTLVSHRVVNMAAHNPTWNVQEWDLKS